MELGDELVHEVLKKEMEGAHVDEIPEGIRLQKFREWLLFTQKELFFLDWVDGRTIKNESVHKTALSNQQQVNGVQFQGCEIRASSEEKQAGLGVFATDDNTQGVLMVTPLILAITPMTVLQDPLLGPQYCRLFEEGDVDDRLLIMLFLLIEHARGESSFWAPYLDVLPSKFGTPLLYSEEALLELKGSSLFHATQQQLRALNAVFKKTVKSFAENVLSSIACEREVNFEDFMWANCIFWTRALNIPCAHSFVFPAQLPIPPAIRGLQLSVEQTNPDSNAVAPFKTDLEKVTRNTELVDEESLTEKLDKNVADPELGDNSSVVSFVMDEVFQSTQNAESNGDETPSLVWVEGLVPGIDFCNHDHRAIALWEVDGPQGSRTGVPNSMYLITGPDLSVTASSEVFISYGNKGNEELLYLYGFVTESNRDDYLMVYFPKEALQNSACSDTKSQLLAELNLPLRWLLPSSELKRGFCGQSKSTKTLVEPQELIVTGHSWSGHRKAPAYVEQIVFPEDLLTALRIVAMEEDDVYHVVGLLEEIADGGLGRAPTDVDIRAAVWEVCGNRRALQLLVDLLTSKMMELEEGTGPEAMDEELLDKDKKAHQQVKEQGQLTRQQDGNEKSEDSNVLSVNKRACVIYRKGQKHLCRLFLQEAEVALEKSSE